MEDFDIKAIVGKYWPATIILIIIVLLIYFFSNAGWSILRHVFYDVFDLVEAPSIVEYRNGEYELTLKYPVEWSRLNADRVKEFGTYLAGWHTGRTAKEGVEESFLVGVLKDDFMFNEYTIDRLMDVVDARKDLKLVNDMGSEDIITKRNLAGKVFLEIETTRLVKDEVLDIVMYIIKMDDIYFNFEYVKHSSLKSDGSILRAVQRALSTLEVKDIDERF